MLWVNGKFVGLKEFSEPTDTKAECLAEAQREVLKILEGAPEGASVLGACIPIPPAPPVAPAVQDSPKPDQTDVHHPQFRI